jgi:chemotaxis signal transduction protein
MSGSAASGSVGQSAGTGSKTGTGHGQSRRTIESLVCFTISGRSYALDVALVREVVTIGTVFPVPQAPAPVAGVFSLRGATVALVDTPTLLGIAATEARETGLVIVRNHQTVCALTIDRVLGVTRFIESNFIHADPEREPPEVMGFMPDANGALLTVLDSTLVLGALNRLRFR